MDSITSLQLDTTQETLPPDSALLSKAREVGAVFILPPHDLDSPLTKEEISPRFGEPVICNGINYTVGAQNYLALVSGERVSEEKMDSPPQNLRQLTDAEDRASMNLNLAILCAHDSVAHRKAGISRFEVYVAKETVHAFERSTLLRRMVHAKFALIFAAQGAIDQLPSQNQSNIIGRLPRHAWLPFWRQMVAQHPKKRIGESLLEESVERYASQHKLPLRGQRVEVEQKTLVPTKQNQLPSSTENECDSMGKIDQQRELSRREVDQQIILSLDLALQNYLPQYKKERLTKKRAPLGRQYLSAIRAAVRQTPSPGARERRARLFRAIEAHHPSLAEDIFQMMLGLAFEKIDNKLK